MTSAAVVFCCVIALGLVQGFGAPAFAGALAADAFNAAFPLIGVLMVARFVAVRYPQRALVAAHAHAAAQGLLVTMSFGWWWVEPHALLVRVGNGSLSSMGWQAIGGAGLGYSLARLADRTSSPTVAREILLGAWALLLIGGGRAYRAFDDVAAGTRLEGAAIVITAVVALAALAWFALRRRERAAMALPALAPALACAALLVASRGGGPEAPAQGDSVLLIVVDTLRADIADGSFDGRTGAMPELERLASAGTRFSQAVSPAPWTLPATVSLLGGWNPHRHGYGASASESEVVAGDPRALHLARTMRDAGYLTAAFVNNPWLRPHYGFDDGFLEMRPYHGRALDGIALLMSWMQGHAGLPSFLVLHVMDPHWPYEAPAGFGEPRQECAYCDSLFATQFGTPPEDVRAEVKRRYAAEVAYTDFVLGQLHDSLAASGVLDRTWVIVTSDHGEELWDHGAFLHGHALHDELLRVPLVVVPPRSRTDAPRGVRSDVQVRLEDVAATVIDIAGQDASLAPDGRSLRPLLGGAMPLRAHTAVAGFVKSPTDLRYAVRRLPWKSVVSPGAMAGNRLFHIGTDPGEQRSLLFDPAVPASQREAATRAWGELYAEPARLGLDVARVPPSPSGVAIEADTKAKLRSLGYAQ